MSIKRLNDEERAAYLIGYAVMRQFEEAPPDPDTISEINAVLRWLEHWLTHEELDHVSLMTGCVFDEDLIDLLENDEALEGRLDSEEPGPTTTFRFEGVMLTALLSRGQFRARIIP
jgi:hypothetical protein